MSELDDGSPDRDIVNRMALEDRDEGYMLDVVAPLVGALEYGKNYVNAQQFADLVRWFQDELEDTDDTMDVGRFELYERIEVVRVKPVTRMTVADVARKTGLPWSTVKDLITATELKATVEGHKKYYNLNDLAPLLKSITERSEE